MTDASSIAAALESMSETEDGHWGVFLVALALLVLASGYVAGSVLAGAALRSQLWILPLLGGCVAVLALLAVDAR
ncbi:MAG: hypothetical protein ABEJ88_07160 [Halobacterium sp.]